MATNRPFVVDATLTALAVGFRNTTAMRIADAVLPRMPVSQERFKWTEYPISEAFNLPDARVSRTGRVNELVFTGTEQTDIEFQKDQGKIISGKESPAETTGKSLRETDLPTGRVTQTQLVNDQGLPSARRLSAVLGLPAIGLCGEVSRQLGDQNVTDRSGANEESGPDAAQSQTACSQLVQGQRTAIQRCGGGFQPQSKTHYEKSLRFQDAEMS
jgi:hypothetical protein